MNSKKPDPFMNDDENSPLTDDEVKRLRPATEVFKELGLPLPQGPGRPRLDAPKRLVTLRLDEDVVEHFKKDGKGWQTRINQVLAEAVRQAPTSKDKKRA
jgi:uncharacterized protein (DUF4415 family)